MLNHFLLRLAALRTRAEGQTLVEYSLILVLIAVASILLLTAVGTDIGEVFTAISTALS